MEDKKSLFIIVSGPAGSGKNTVAERLIADFPQQISRVTTSTSRPPRGEEKEGVDYYFLSASAFESAIERGDFYEYAKVHDRYYGTSKAAVKKLADAGKDLIFIIDVQGARTWRKIAEKDPYLKERMISIFIRPRSVDELRSRLRGRATESEADIERRMQTAIEEFKHADEFDYVIDSDTKDDDYAAFKKIYLERKNAH